MKKDTNKHKKEMLTNLLCIAVCEPICANDVEIGFFSGNWAEKAIKKGLLKKTEVTEMQTFCDTDEYSLTKEGWRKIRKRVKPLSNNKLEYFFAQKCK